MVTIQDVMQGMNLTGNEDQEPTIQIYMDEEKITPGLVVRGVSDLWNYGGGKGELSPYFKERATQISY